MSVKPADVRRIAFQKGRLAGIKTERGCAECGYNADPAALQFHHTDPKTKSFSPAGNASRTWAAIAAEVEKCVVLCSNCHATHHYGDSA